MIDKSQLTNIAELAKDFEERRMIFEAHRMANTPTDPEKRCEAAVEYHLAETAMMRAWNFLEKAKREAASV